MTARRYRNDTLGLTLIHVEAECAQLMLRAEHIISASHAQLLHCTAADTERQQHNGLQISDDW